MERDISQIRAITANAQSSALVVAPPGYGKTQVMSRRISYLIHTGALQPPKRLLGLTFTNAAAAEMAERVGIEIPQRKLENVDLSTIHSFCYQVLSAYGTNVSIQQQFSILSETQLKDGFHSEAKKRGIDLENDIYDKTYMIYRNWVTERILKKNTNFIDSNLESLFTDLYHQHTARFHDENCIDFDHILSFTYDLFMEHPQVLELYRAVYKYILVDEFQDTNPLQFDIVALLVEGHPQKDSSIGNIPIFLFGDEDQAIYQFLGATPENVKKGVARFNCQVHRLEMNHRTSSPKILELSSTLRTDVETQNSTHPASLYINENEREEAEAIKQEIESLKLPLHRICVISPQKKRLQFIQEVLIGSIPIVFIPDFAGTSIEREFIELFHGLRSIAPNIKGSLLAKINELLPINTIPNDQRDVVSLIREMAHDYDSRFKSVNLDLRTKDFINHLLLDVNWGQLVRQNVKEKVFVSTIHGVKGLEFDHVILCGLENYQLPNHTVCVDHCNHGNLRATLDLNLMEAERLFYVGITRSVDNISLYSLTTWNGKKRKVSCLLNPLSSHLQSTSGKSVICGYTKFI